MTTVKLDWDFGYIVAVIFYSQILNLMLMIQVVTARKKYDVKYPALYADKSTTKFADDFNSV